MPAHLRTAVRSTASLARALRHLRRHFGVSPHRALADFWNYHRAIDTGVGDFLYARLWDRSLPDAERRRVLAHEDRLRLQPRMSTRAEHEGIRDKARIKERLVAAGVAVPRTVAVVAPGADLGAGADRVVRSEEEFASLLDEPHPDGIVCKPVRGLGGNDVHVFRASHREGLTHVDGSEWSTRRLWARLTAPRPAAGAPAAPARWLVEERTPPHPDLARIHGETLGCVRMVAIHFADDTVTVINPTWKIPVGTSGVDNNSFGSLLGPVDPATGRIALPLVRSTMLDHRHHPTTGVELPGIGLPDWRAANILVDRAMRAVPECRSIGFDVGLTNSGPRIIEANVYWGVWMMQTHAGSGLIQGEFLRFLEELGAEDVIRRRARRI